VDVAETVVGLRGGDIEGVSDFTSRFFLQAQSPDRWLLAARS
jgi:hypothetical protein